VDQGAHARWDRLAIARRGFELPALDGLDRRMIVVSADAIVDVSIEHRTVRCDRDDHDHVDIVVGRYVSWPLSGGLQADVWRHDRVGRLRDAPAQQ